MELQQYTDLQCDILLEVLEGNVAKLKYSLFEEILTHLQISNFVDDAYCDSMREERRRIKKKIQ